jgi:hypothetical protein
MESLERQGFQRLGSIQFKYEDGKRTPVYEGAISSRAKSKKTRALRQQGLDAKYQKVGPGRWAVWVKKRSSGDYDKFKQRYDNAKKFTGARSMGDVFIQAGDIKMKRLKNKKLVPEDPQIRKLMSKEKAKVDSTGKRIILPMKRDVFSRTKRRYHKRHTYQRRTTARRYHSRRNTMKWVWPFSLK